MKLKIAYESAIGSRHLKEEIPCQDALKIGRNQNDFLVVISDGAGSKKYAYETAELICAKVMDLYEKHMLKQAFDERVLFEILNSELKSTAFNRTEMGATMIVLYYFMKELYIAHIGDGAVLCDYGNGFSALSESENGENSWETYLLPCSDEEKIHFRVKNIKVNQTAYILCGTDGVMTSLYSKKSDEIAPACDIFKEWMDVLNESELSAALKKCVASTFSKINSDDKTIVLIKLFEEN